MGASTTTHVNHRPRPWRENPLRVRSSGVLLHISSLPGPHGNGDLGVEARSFADFLARAGQRWWQMLPVGPVGYGDSPYAALSAFAGNPAFVNLAEAPVKHNFAAG